MKKTNNFVIIDDKVAEAINLFKFDKFDSQNEKNNINYSIDFPILISNTQNVVDKLIDEGKLVEPIFNNIVKNEEEYCSLYLKNNGKKYLTNRLVTEISNSHGFDFEKKINVFVPNIVEKLAQIFSNKYAKIIKKPTPYDIQLVADKHNMPYKDIKWTFDQIRKVGVEKCIYSVIDLNLDSDRVGTPVDLNPIYPKTSKLIPIIARLLDTESIDVEVYFEYFKRVFGDLYIDIHPFNQQTTNLNYEQKEIYISYLKLLAMRVFEYFDIFKIVSVDTEYINKLSVLLLQIQDEISFLERNLIGA